MFMPKTHSVAVMMVVKASRLFTHSANNMAFVWSIYGVARIRHPIFLESFIFHLFFLWLL